MSLFCILFVTLLSGTVDTTNFCCSSYNSVRCRTGPGVKFDSVTVLQDGGHSCARSTIGDCIQEAGKCKNGLSSCVWYQTNDDYNCFFTSCYSNDTCCQISNWSGWSNCVNGTQKRTRTVQPFDNNKACPELVDFQRCIVPVDKTLLLATIIVTICIVCLGFFLYGLYIYFTEKSDYLLLSLHDNDPGFDHRGMSQILDVVNEPNSTLNVIDGLLDEPVCNFSEILNLLQPIIRDIDTFGSKCKLFADNYTEPTTLSWDEIAAISLYTREWHPQTDSLYFILNRALRNEDRRELRPLFPYLSLLLHGLAKLPNLSYETIIWRGMKGNMSREYPKGSLIVWWGFSSCTLDMTSLTTFLGTDGESTLFSVQAESGVSIEKYSAFPNEKEVLLFPCITFEVVNTFSSRVGLWIVQLKEIRSPAALITGFNDLYS